MPRYPTGNAWAYKPTRESKPEPSRCEEARVVPPNQQERTRGEELEVRTAGTKVPRRRESGPWNIQT